QEPTKRLQRRAVSRTSCAGIERYIAFVRILWNFSLLAAFLCGAAAQSKQNFSGTWILDEARSGPAHEVWFSSRAHKFVISQAGPELIIDAGGGIADVRGALAYNVDGREITTVNDSIGEIPGWTRKLRTKAVMDGDTLVTYTSHVSITDRENVAVT